VIAEGRDEIGGERDGLAIFEQKRETLGELDDEPGPELAWEFDFDEACFGTVQRLRGAGIETGNSG
jgi:hypothetical protein